MSTYRSIKLWQYFIGYTLRIGSPVYGMQILFRGFHWQDPRKVICESHSSGTFNLIHVNLTIVKP